MLFWGLISIIWFCQIKALRDDKNPFVVDYHEHYYYKNLQLKMQESMSVNNCSISGALHSANFDENADISVRIILPHKDVIEKWGPSSFHKTQSRIFAQVNDYTCSSKRYNDIKTGNYRRSKGCYKVYATDKNGEKKKRMNAYGATLHPEHIRCDLSDSSNICGVGSAGPKLVPNRYRELNSYPFLVTAKKTIVSRGGMLALPCGPFGLFSSCEAVNWGLAATIAAFKNVSKCSNNNNNCPYKMFQRVFVMTQYDDTQIGQFMQEALPKLIYHYEFLKANPDVYIHYGFTKQMVMPNYVLPHNFFHWLGLEHRLINGTIFADEVYMPREGGCQDIGKFY
jgi:hypothetical protein